MRLRARGAVDVEVDAREEAGGGADAVDARARATRPQSTHALRGTIAPATIADTNVAGYGPCMVRSTLVILFVLFALPTHAAPPEVPAHAVVELVEVTDFQCPFCKRAQVVVGQLVARYGDKLSLRLVHQPLSFHARAEEAARVAEAAALQGQRLPMAALLFSGALDHDTYLRYALELGLDLTRFDRDLRSAAVAATVAHDQATAIALGATGTPTFFVNGQLIRGAQPIEAFVELIAPELALAGDRSGPAWIAQRTRTINPRLYQLVYAAPE